MDLDLRLGWDRFEKLILAVVRRALGLRGIKFRRYGVQGQAQHGIDLVGLVGNPQQLLWGQHRSVTGFGEAGFRK